MNALAGKQRSATSWRQCVGIRQNARMRLATMKSRWMATHVPRLPLGIERADPLRSRLISMSGLCVCHISLHSLKIKRLTFRMILILHLVVICDTHISCCDQMHVKNAHAFFFYECTVTRCIMRNAIFCLMFPFGVDRGIIIIYG